MENYAILFFLSVMVIVCTTEAILGFRRGERGFIGEMRPSHSFFDEEYRWMWLIIGIDALLFGGYYLIIG